MATNFQKSTGIAVNMTQRSSDEALAQVRAEVRNPRKDVWFGGTGDPQLIAAEENLTVEYKSANIAEYAVPKGSFGRPRADGRTIVVVSL